VRADSLQRGYLLSLLPEVGRPSSILEARKRLGCLKKVRTTEKSQKPQNGTETIRRESDHKMVQRP